jgi:hypothetical protein
MDEESAGPSSPPPPKKKKYSLKVSGIVVEEHDI